MTEWYRYEASAIIDIFIGTEKISCTTNHPFWVEGKGWQLATQPKSGAVLLDKAGDSLTIDEVRRRDEVTQIHNVEIDGLHTYFVSDVEVLAHNACGDVGKGIGDDAGDIASSSVSNMQEFFEPDLFKGNQAPNASELADIAEKNGLTKAQSPSGPVKYLDANGVARVTLKKGSPRAPGSGSPHAEFRDASGQRVDPFGNPVTRRSPENHTPINYDL